MSTGRRFFALSLTVLAVLALAVGCEADTGGDVRLSYEAVRVTESDGGVLIGGDEPGGYYTAYEVPPSYPLTIESTAFLEVRESTIRPSDEAGGGDGDSGDWERSDVARARLTIAPNAECERFEPPTCETESCSFQLRMPRDGVCITELTLTTPDDRVAADCWGFGWADGRGQGAEQREELTDSMIQRRDDYCQDG